MAIDFPNAPTTNQTYTVGDRKWVYDGEKWTVVPASPELLVVSPTPPTNTNVIWADTSVAGTMNSIVPSGGLMPFAGITAPLGWLLCFGQTLSRTTYPDLFAVVGTTYNTGGEAGTVFRLPDLRGRTVAGIDNMGGTDAGRLDIANSAGTVVGSQYVTLTSSQSGVPAHSHPNTLTSNTVASDGHSHAGQGSLNAAIGATNGDPSRIGYIAGTVAGPGTATYSITGGSLLTNTGNFNHYTPVYGSTGGNSGSTTVGITNNQNTAANASSAHNNMQPTIILNYIIKT
jgi:microcystin-dependent protein